MNPFTLSDLDRFVMRPASADDLETLERFARQSVFGITTLPTDRQTLKTRLEQSRRAFADEDEATGEEIYLFVLEDRASRRVVGTSGIAASAGGGRHFYSYRNEYIVHSSPVPGAHARVHTLSLCQDLTGATLLTSFYIEPEYEATLAPQLLSRGRLLFVAQFADRFAQRVAAESPGLADDDGNCPFWAAVGECFFGMPYPEVERLSVGRTKAFIGQLLPQSPLYVSLMPKDAQWAIGQLHPVAELPFSILQDEGFDADTYVDIFDAGPIVDASVASLRTVASSRLARVSVGRRPAPDAGVDPGTLHLAATVRRDSFKAAFALAGEGVGELTSDVASTLQVAATDWVRIAPVFGSHGATGGRDA